MHIEGGAQFGWPVHRVRTVAWTALASGVLGLLYIANLDRTPNPLFHPHGYCYLWEPALVGAHVGADAVIGTSYLAISCTLAYLFYRVGRGVPFSWMFLIFGAFIVACGSTHFMEVVTLWSPAFWSSAALKIVTAIASVGAALVLPPLVPRFVGLLDAARVAEQRREQLEALTEALENRVAERTRELHAAAEREQAARHSAEEANRAKEQFLGVLSHELRTPLNAVMGWASMLASPQSLTADAQQRAAQSILRNAHVQSRLVNDLLDVTAILSGKLQIHRQPTPVAAVVTAAVDVIRPLAEAKTIDLRVEGLDHVARVDGDPQRLQQVVWNLLSNAVKFTDPQGSIVVTVSASDIAVRIAVRDTGMGIDAELLPRVFDRFTQGDSSMTRSAMGLGLGLTLVRQLVELHDGSVHGHSDGRGQGAEFTVELPRLP